MLICIHRLYSHIKNSILFSTRWGASVVWVCVEAPESFMNGREAHNIGRGNVHKLNFRSMNGSEAHKMLDSEVYLCFVLTNVAGPVSRRESSER